MSGTYTPIAEADMRSFLESEGFTEVKLDGTKEVVYSKVIARRTCLRVYTSVAYGQSRGCSEDAIRLCVVYRQDDGTIVGIGRDARVYRIKTWKQNLQKRLEKYNDLIGPTCICGNPTRLRKGKYGEFFGCVTYPICRYVYRLENKKENENS